MMQIDMKRLFILFLLTPLFTFSQKTNGSLRGKVISADGEPATGVTVELKKARRIAMTDGNGIFFLQHLQALSDTLVISSVAANFYIQDVKLKAGEALNIGSIRLTYNIARLQA